MILSCEYCVVSAFMSIYPGLLETRQNVIHLLGREVIP